MNYILAGIILTHTFTMFASCKIESHCTWQNLDEGQSITAQQAFGGKWILAATITFKRKSADDIYVSLLDLSWQGIPLTKLNATLFRCDLDKPFVPLEENVVADGTWSQDKQMLRFSFKEKERLQATHTFGLVLTVPSDLETTIKTGYFNLVPTSLPQPLQATAQQHPLHVQFMLPTQDTLVS